jgi:hypothetical protein
MVNVLEAVLSWLGLLNVVPAPAPDPLPVAWVGIDRSSIPKSGNPAAPNPNWLGLMIDNSNLRLCGAYLEGAAPAGHPTTEFTNSTQDVARGWIPNVGTLWGQGWGIAFFYVGYSVGGGEPMPSAAAARTSARGRLHAQHAKEILKTITPQPNGAVVYFDNEDGTGTNTSSLNDYYGGFFDELQTPDIDHFAARVGLYAHNLIASAFLATRPYLFVWEVTFDTATTTTSIAPFVATTNPLQVDATRKLQAIRLGTAPNEQFIWPVGRQFRSYTGQMPKAGSPLATAVPALNPLSTWDYDTSAVRDPSYPEGEPRLAVIPGPVVVVGQFAGRRTTGGANDPPRMTIDRIDTARTAVLTAATRFVEPDAPIVSASFPSTNRTDYATILISGDLASFNNTGGTWSNIDAATPTPPAMRRQRALALAAFAANDLQLFFVSSDLRLNAIRQTGGAAWTAPAVMGAAGFVLHPFSQLAVAVRSGANVNVFAVDQAGLLSTAFWDSSMPAFPGIMSMALQTTPSLLRGTALAAVSPDTGKIIVFGIGTDLRLYYWEWSFPPGWSGPTALGAAGDFVAPHSRLAAYAVTPSRVEVAAVTDRGEIRVYPLTGPGSTWTQQTPVVVANPPATAPAGFTPAPPGALTDAAFGYRINPFGDLGICMVNLTTNVFAAGIKDGLTAVLRIATTLGSVWELYR